MPSEFMFATGVECSYPTLENGRWRHDAMLASDHYKKWKDDLHNVSELRIRYLRYGPPLHLVFLGPGRYNWDFMDGVCDLMRQLRIEPIMDLCHFGVPDWLENFQNPEFPERMAEYAAAFADRYPWVRFYTPVNEMYVTARNSALYGMWNEQLRSEQAFVTALKHLAKASALMMEVLTNKRRDVIFLNSESSEFCQPCCPDERVQKIADFENERRFVALDLLYNVSPRKDILQYLLENGMTRDELNWFAGHHEDKRAILGIDYYEWNETLIDSKGCRQNLGELFGWYVITHQYYERYKRVLMHSETNYPDAEKAPAWLWRQWHNVELIRKNGIPVVGFTWYSLTDQIDWDRGMSKPLGNVYPVGLFDLNRTPRSVAFAYRHLIEVNSPHVELQVDLEAPEISIHEGQVSLR